MKISSSRALSLTLVFMACCFLYSGAVLAGDKKYLEFCHGSKDCSGNLSCRKDGRLYLCLCPKRGDVAYRDLNAQGKERSHTPRVVCYGLGVPAHKCVTEKGAKCG